MGPRREGRELALKMLYREEVTGVAAGLIPGIEDTSPQAKRFAGKLVDGVREKLPSIDSAIVSASEHWEIDRMGAVDRTILRIGVFELMFAPETPVGVIINEAVEIARKYSSGDCPRFVNGVLDRIAKEKRPRRGTAEAGE